MYASYMMGVYVGLFVMGALVGGIIPCIIFAVKKHWGLALLSPILCGFAAFFHSIASIALGIILIIYAISTPNNRE